MRNLVMAAACGILILSGCTATTPEPSPSGEAECGSDDARVRWGQLAPAEPVPLGYRVVTVEAGVTEESEITELDYSTTVTSDETRFEEPEWVEFLLEDLNRTGQSVVELGDRPPNFESNTVAFQADGEFVVGYRGQTEYASFSIECGLITEGDGTIITRNGGLDLTTVQCGEPPLSGGQYAIDLQQYCPE